MTGLTDPTPIQTLPYKYKLKCLVCEASWWAMDITAEASVCSCGGAVLVHVITESPTAEFYQPPMEWESDCLNCGYHSESIYKLTGSCESCGHPVAVVPWGTSTVEQYTVKRQNRLSIDFGPPVANEWQVEWRPKDCVDWVIDHTPSVYNAHNYILASEYCVARMVDHPDREYRVLPCGWASAAIPAAEPAAIPPASLPDDGETTPVDNLIAGWVSYKIAFGVSSSSTPMTNLKFSSSQ